jgi:hypothetical protein
VTAADVLTFVIVVLLSKCRVLITFDADRDSHFGSRRAGLAPGVFLSSGPLVGLSSAAARPIRSRSVPAGRGVCPPRATS